MSKAGHWGGCVGWPGEQGARAGALRTQTSALGPAIELEVAEGRGGARVPLGGHRAEAPALTPTQRALPEGRCPSS